VTVIGVEATSTLPTYPARSVVSLKFGPEACAGEKKRQRHEKKRKKEEKGGNSRQLKALNDRSLPFSFLFFTFSLFS
jgi:hypothetical protein